MNSRAHQRGFSVIELMVTIAIIGWLITLGVPTIGRWFADAHVRGAADQKSLDSSLASGTPTVTMTINANCTWTTKISTNTNSAHTLAATPTTMACAPATTGGVPTLPVTITFSPQGFVDKAGTLVMTGTTQTYQLQLLYSGSVIETHAASGVES